MTAAWDLGLMLRKRNLVNGTAIVVALGGLAIGRASAAEFGLRTFLCEGVSEPSAGEGGAPAPLSVTFEATVIFADGEFLALVDPETGKPSRPLAADAMTRGSLEIVGREPEPMVWTTATGARATLIGFVVRSDSNLVALTINGAPAGEKRAFTLYDARSGMVQRGQCR
jgi:hypothetical protein